MSGDHAECPCINSTMILSKHAVENCIFSGSSLSSLSSAHTCYPIDYGAESCKAHDMDVVPACKDGGDKDIPQFCHEKWCFVDFDKCKKSSFAMHRSNHFGDLGLYYSYSTCNGTQSYWQNFSTVSSLMGKNLTITIPRIYFPYTFKRDSNGSIIPDGWNTQEYYDDNIPFEGSYIDFVQHILRDSGIDSLKFVSVSKGSFQDLPSVTATVLDVQRGLSNMGLADFWITPQRLNMTTFTIPLFNDRILLWVKAPQVDNSFNAKIRLTMMPFQWGLWSLLAGIILLVGLLNVWFSQTNKWNAGERTFWKSLKGNQWKKVTTWHRIRTIFGELGDAFIASSLGFFVGAIESNHAVPLPTKVLHFGYGFLVLVAVGAYTANLVTFMTSKQVGFYYETMEMAINHNARICVMDTMKPSRWPNANFVFRSTEMDMLLAIDEGVCDSLLYGLPAVRDNADLMEAFCERQLVATRTEALSIGIGFPAGNDVAAAISYWMKKALEEGARIEDFNKQYQSPPVCSLKIDLSPPDEEEEMNRLSISEMIFPLTVFFVSAGLAVLIKVWKVRKTAKQKIKDSFYSGTLSRIGIRGSQENLAEKRQAWASEKSECGKGKDMRRSEANKSENIHYLFKDNQICSDNDLKDVQQNGTFFHEPGQSSCVHKGALNEIFIDEEITDIEQTNVPRVRWKTDVEGAPSNAGKFGSTSFSTNNVRESGMNEIMTNAQEELIDNPDPVHWKTDTDDLLSSMEKSRLTRVPANSVQEFGANETIENEQLIFLKQVLSHAQKSEVMLRHIMDTIESRR